jgi:hypothetical protein
MHRSCERIRRCGMIPWWKLILSNIAMDNETEEWGGPVGAPLKGTTISFRGPPEACVTGITPAALIYFIKLRKDDTHRTDGTLP